MRVFELPIPLWPGKELALGVAVERISAMNSGWNIFLGNGKIPNGDIVGCEITLAGQCDDSLAIFVNGVPLKDDALPSGSDPLDFDLFALALAAGMTLNTGDLVELFGKDNIAIAWSTHPWSAVLTFDDASEVTITGGEYKVALSDFAPNYRPMGAFTLGAKAEQVATSYQRLDGFQWHAMAGSLLVDYPSDAPIIDDDGLMIEITGADTELDEYTEFNAFANDLMVLIDDELFSVAGATLLSSGVYQLSVFRARLGTSKQAHSAGSEVYLFSKDELYSFSHPIAQPGNGLALKVALFGGNLRGDSSEVDAFSFNVTGSRIAQPVRNLALDEQISGAVRSVGDDFELTWSLPDFLDVPTGWTFQTLIEIEVDGIVSLEVTSDESSLTVLAATIDPLLASGDFTVRAYLVATANGLTIKSEAAELSVNVL